MRFILIVLLTGIGSLAAIQSTIFAACLFLWHDIFRPQDFARSGGALPLPIYVVLVLGLSFALNWMRGKFKPKWNSFLTITIFFLVWIYFTVLRSSFGQAQIGYIEILKYLLPLFLISTAIQNKLDAKYLLAILMLSVGIWGAQAGVKGIMSGVANNMSIPGGQMSDNNDFMVAVDSIVPLLIYFCLSYKNRFKLVVRFSAFILLILCLCAVVFSNSRGATIGLAGSIIIYTLIISRKKIRDGILLGLIVVIVLQVLPDTYFERLSTINLGAEQSEASASSRMDLAKAAFRGTLANPIFGVGPTCWLLASLNYGDNDSEPHNVWLKCSVETGIPGLIFFVSIIGLTIYKALKIRRQSLKNGDEDMAQLATALCMTVIGFAIPSTFVSHPFSEHFWAIMAITNGLASRVIKRPKEYSIRKNQVPKSLD